jgi:hypothetical protein
VIACFGGAQEDSLARSISREEEKAWKASQNTTTEKSALRETRRYFGA